MQSQSLSPCQFKALQALATDQNVFLTGAAGTGKSFLVRLFMNGLDRKKWPILASTGAAAIRVNGRTFHSFFGLGIMEGGYDRTIERALKDKRVVRRVKKAVGIIIDEISMIPGPALRAAEEIARMSREDVEIPWGGLRVVAVGDFAQLPPVTRNQSHRPWAFLDPVWQRTEFNPVVLKTIQRSDDEEFLEVLGKIRHGIIDSDVESYLEDRVTTEFEDIQGTRLFPRRDATEKYNLSQLAELHGNEVGIETVYSGRQPYVDSLRRQAPVPEVLRLKQGAFVMIRQNDPKGRWVNGTLGHISEMGREYLLIDLIDGPTIELEKSTFELLDAEGKSVASCTNFPVNLAYATTIHKAQGATFDALLVDLGRLWEPGQAYVALSRLRSGAGLFISKWSKPSFRVDSEVMKFHEDLEN